MRIFLLIIFLALVGIGRDVQAQLPQENMSMPESWQLTVDVIKSKAYALGVVHDQLEAQYRQLIRQLEDVEQSIAEGQHNNETLALSLKQHHEHNDARVLLEEVVRVIKSKRQQKKTLEKQLEDLRKQHVDFEDKIQALKETLVQDTQALPPTTLVNKDSLMEYRKQLEEEKVQERLLEDQVKALHVIDKPKFGCAHDKNLSFERLRQRKEDLEIKIAAYESQIDRFKHQSLMALTGSFKKKELVHSLVVVDRRNNQLRAKIKVIQEDIDVLKNQVATLERRVDFIQDKTIKTGAGYV